MTEGWKSHNHQARMLLNGTVQGTDCHHHIVANPHPNPPARSHRGRHRVPYYEQLRPLVPNVTLALKYLTILRWETIPIGIRINQVRLFLKGSRLQHATLLPACLRVLYYVNSDTEG